MTSQQDSNLWFEFVRDNHCGLCGNSGRITTSIFTPTGHLTGVSFAPCICPNGRAMKKADANAARRKVLKR
jgi:hypothetical protein